jgi:hypothetical protein
MNRKKPGDRKMTKNKTVSQKLAIATAALESIAVWSDGNNLRLLDEPGSAQTAREALAKIK